jgi:hypothetical protein
MQQYHLELPEFTKLDPQFGDASALRHVAGTPFDNTVRVYKPTHIESIMRSIIGPSFDRLIAKQEISNAQ